MPTQLIAFPYNGGYTYGELVDKHIMRGSSRALYVSQMKQIPLSSEWLSYLSNIQIEIETKTGWYKCTLLRTAASQMLETPDGYKIPILCISGEYACYYPTMLTEPSMPRSVVRPPPIIVHTAPVCRITTRRTMSVQTTNDECDSEDEGRKDLDAFHAYLLSQRKRRRVSFK